MIDPKIPQSPKTPSQNSLINKILMALDHDLRIRIGIIVVFGGFVILLIGCHPQIIGMDRSPLIGIVQIVFFEFGLLVICLGGYITMLALWKGQPFNIPADIGLRLIGSGYVISFFSGFADYFGFGSHKPPNFPFFGPWHARGVMAGEGIIMIGFLMMIPYFLGKSGHNPPNIKENQEKKSQVSL